MTNRARTLFVGIALLTVLPAAAQAGEAPPGSTWSEAPFESTDGTVLHADVFRPPVAGPRPVVLVISPYLGIPTTESPQGPHVPGWYRRLYERALGRGFAVVQVSVRGTGASGGCLDFGGPGERADVARAIGWAADQPWSSGRVGILGHSYDGWAGVIAMADRVERLAAAVLIGPVVDPYRSSYMNGVPYVQSRVAAPYYQAFGVIPPLPGSAETAPTLLSRLDDPGCQSRTVLGAGGRDPGAAFWREREHYARAAGSDVPVFWAHGFLDGKDDYSAVRPSSFLRLWRELAGPRRAWFGQFSHVVPGEDDTWGRPQPVGREGFAGEALDWLEAHVAQDAAARARVAAAPEIALQEGVAGGWRRARQWPPPDTAAHSLRVLPGSYLDLPGNKAESGPVGGRCFAIQARCNPLARPGRGTWTLSRPLTRDVQLAGVPQLTVGVSAPRAGANLIALVYDVDAAGRASLITRGAYLLRAPALTARFDLYPQDWRLRAGHRIGLLLSGSDDLYYLPASTGTTVKVGGGALTMPLLAPPPAADLPGGPSLLVMNRTTFSVPATTIAARSTGLQPPG